MARTNSFPTFKPTSMQIPPEDGFKPASLILSDEINCVNYMNYNFVHSFIDALIKGGNTSDSDVYTYNATNLKELITTDLTNWVHNIIGYTPTFTTVTVSSGNNTADLGSTYVDFIVSTNSNKYETTYGYYLVNFVKRNTSDVKLSTTQFNLEELTYLFSDDTTNRYTKVNMIPAPFNSPKENNVFNNVLSKTFKYTESSDSINTDLRNFLNNHTEINSFNVVVKRTLGNGVKEWIPVTLTRNTSNYLVFDYYYIDKTTGTMTKTADLKTLYVTSDFWVTVMFC